MEENRTSLGHLHYQLEEYGIPVEAYCFGQLGELPSRLSVGSLNPRALTELTHTLGFARITSNQKFVKRTIRTTDALYQRGTLVAYVDIEERSVDISRYFREADRPAAEAIGSILLRWHPGKATPVIDKPLTYSI